MASSDKEETMVEDDDHGFTRETTTNLRKNLEKVRTMTMQAQTQIKGIVKKTEEIRNGIGAAR